MLRVWIERRERGTWVEFEQWFSAPLWDAQDIAFVQFEQQVFRAPKSWNNYVMLKMYEHNRLRH